MKKLLSISFWLLTATIAVCQDITRQEADSMVLALKKSNTEIDRIPLLLSLAQFQIFKPGEIQTDFDSAQVYISKATALNKTIKSKTTEGSILFTSSLLTREKGQQEEAKIQLEKSITLLEPGSNNSDLGKAYYELSGYYDYRDSKQLPQKVILVEKSVVAFQSAGNWERKGFSLKMLGDLYKMQDEKEKAIYVLKQALALYDSINYKKQHGVCVLIGQVYMLQNNYGQSLYYLLKALKIAHEVNDTTMQLCQINNLLGALYLRIDRKEMSVKYLEDALATAKKYNEESSITLLSTNIVVTYNNLNEPERALSILSSIPDKFRQSTDNLQKAFIGMAYLRTYTTLRQFTKGQPWCDTLLRLASVKKGFVDFTKNNIYRLAASYYLESGQYDKTHTYLLKNVELIRKTNNVLWILQDARLWYKLDSINGNFKSAFQHLLYFKTKTDSINAENKIRQLQVVEVEYETAKKEDSIRSKDHDIFLLTQKNKLQQENLQQARLIKNITIAGIILAAIIIGLLYRQYRHKQKSTNIITEKNDQLQHLVTEKEWLLKEIHHRVKNNFQTVMGLLGTQSGYLKNEEAIKAITDSQHRIHAMSMIHQRLYQTENLSAINMRDYVHELVDYLSDSFDNNNLIRIDQQIEPIELNLSQCIPVGLILNEAITNSFKYAFPEGKEGIITISFKQTAENSLALTIRDNGIGLPANKQDSMGMNLIKGLCNEIGATFSAVSENGTKIEISFLHDHDHSASITEMEKA